MSKIELTPGQINALEAYLDELYDGFHLQSVIHLPKSDVLALVDSHGIAHMIIASLFLKKGIAMTSDLDAVMIYKKEESEDCDDLYHTFMGSDDEVRDGCWE